MFLTSKTKLETGRISFSNTYIGNLPKVTMKSSDRTSLP